MTPAAPSYLFKPDSLSLGLVLPIQSGGVRDVDYGRQLALARRADRLGFAGLWVRDVPLNSPGYPDPVGHADPWVLLGALAASTERTALLTGAIVLPLRHPLHVAKAALSVDALSGGRFVLGLGSGDRPSEFAAFGRDHAARRDLFRSGWSRLASALGPDRKVVPDREDGQSGSFELLPRDAHRDVPMLVVGSARQPLEWIARNAIGWATYHREPEVQRDRLTLWQAAVAKHAHGTFRSFSQALSLDLADDPDLPREAIGLGYRLGRRTLVELLGELGRMGVHHVMFNLVDNGRPVGEVLEELGTDVMPAIVDRPDRA